MDSSSSSLKDIHKTQELNTQETEIASSQPSSSIVPAAQEAEILVQISPHSSLERDQYIYYLPSLSQVTQSSQTEQAASSIGESSPPPISSPFVVHDQVGIIPDLQSLPNSSSYHPTTTKPTISSSVTQTVGDVNPFEDPRLLHKNDLLSATSATSSDSIEDRASPLVILRRGTRTSSRLSKSSPSQNSERVLRKARNSFAAHKPPAAANTEAAHNRQGPENSVSPISTAFPAAGIGHDLDELSQFQPVIQGTTGLGRSDLSPVNDKLSVGDRQPGLSEVTPAVNDSSELAFQTQIPYLFDSQIQELKSCLPSATGESVRFISLIRCGRYVYADLNLP